VITSEAAEAVVSVIVSPLLAPVVVYEIQYSTAMKWLFENGPTVPVV
jgi:hypothetical protein